MAGVIDWREVGGDSDDTRAQDGRDYVRQFTAKVDSAATRGWHVKADPRCPKVYQFDQEGGGFCKAVSAVRRKKTPRIFDVLAQYGFDLGEEPDADPLARAAEISSQGIERQVPVTKDIDGTPIANTAGDLFEGVMVDEPGVIFKVQKKIPAGPAAWLLRSANHTNANAVKIDGLDCEAGTLLVRKPFVGFRQRENDVDFRQAQLELHYSPSAWMLRLWNRGFHAIHEQYVINPTTLQAELVRQKVVITDDQGEPIRKPQFLDAEGRQILKLDADGIWRAKQPLDADDLIELEFRIRGEIDFGDLPLR